MKNILDSKIAVVILTILLAAKSYRIIASYIANNLRSIFTDGRSTAYSLGILFAHFLILFATIIYLKKFVTGILAPLFK